MEFSFKIRILLYFIRDLVCSDRLRDEFFFTLVESVVCSKNYVLFVKEITIYMSALSPI